jgi:hypothetical protein
MRLYRTLGIYMYLLAKLCQNSQEHILNIHSHENPKL